MQVPNINKIHESKVFLRVDFDVPINDGKLDSTYRIDRCKETINLLQKNNNKIVLFTKLGRPVRKNKKLSTINLLPHVKQVFGDVFFARNIDELEAAMSLSEYKLILFENTRFFNWEKQPKNNLKNIKRIAGLFDVYVDEAFAMSHRKETSNFIIPKIIGNIFIGHNYKQEVSNLSNIRYAQFNKPAIFVLGGAKPETKIPMINSLISKFTYFLVGGKLASTNEIKNLAKKSKKIIPLKLNASGFDISKTSADTTTRAIMLAKTVVWNGPVGMFEKPKFSIGTRAVVKAINNKKGGYVVAGGGDTITAIEKFGTLENFSFISTGGGAMFSFLSGNKTNIETLIKE